VDGLLKELWSFNAYRTDSDIIIKVKIMKKNFLWMTIAMIAVMCVSCSNNDDEFVNLAQKVAGVYKGDVSATFKYSPAPL